MEATFPSFNTKATGRMVWISGLDFEAFNFAQKSRSIYCCKFPYKPYNKKEGMIFEESITTLIVVVPYTVRIFKQSEYIN